MNSIEETPRYRPEDIRPGDWIKYRSSYYGGGRVTEVEAIATMGPSGVYAITTEGNVPLRQILEVRRYPSNVLELKVGQ